MTTTRFDMKSFSFWSILFLSAMVSAGLSCTSLSGKAYEIHKSAISKKGMVVSAHPLASEVGLKILKQGGNAADAAIAVQLALAVVYPRAGNIGGGGFLVYRDRQGLVTSLDFREKAPLASHKDMFLDSTGQFIEELSTLGILSAGIPGTISGLIETHQKLGKIESFSKLVQPAIELAEHGYRITKSEAMRLNANQDAFVQFNTTDIPFVSTVPWKEGDLLVQKELASTLRLIAEKGREGFYSGPVAESIVSHSSRLKGIITLEDLKSYTAVWRKPWVNTWRGFKLYSMSLPSSGGIVLGQILGMIEERLVDTLGYRHQANIHLMVEAERRAYADRARFLGDTDFYPIDPDSLMDKVYLQNKFLDFDPLVASDNQSIYPSSSGGVKDRFETTHISIVDGEGNAASVTTTLNDNYGSKVWVPGGGFFLNNEMDDFSVKPGVPNSYGLIGGEANAIAPGKRMLSSMTPTIIEKDGNLWMVVGTPGGSTIITSVLQVFLHMTAFGMTVDDAVQSPRFHHQGLPDEIIFEKEAFPPELIEILKSMGHTLRSVDYIGLIEAIYIDDQGVLHGAADRRGDDHASGW